MNSPVAPLPPSHFMAAFQPALASFQYDAFPLVIIAILTPDRLLLPIAPWIFVVSACSAASLNEDEPTIELAPPLDAEGEEVALAAELAALLAAVLAGADELLCRRRGAAARASAPAVTARPAPPSFCSFISPCFCSREHRGLINVRIH